jgi:two-component system, sensor histidine kinase and response regulator
LRIMHVLLVDDDEKNRDLQSRIVARLGNSVETVNTGEEGVVKVLENKYDLVFFDCILPGIDGLEAIQQIREKEKGRRTPVVVLTGATEKMDYVGAGFDDFMSKPISIDEFKTILAKWERIIRASRPH